MRERKGESAGDVTTEASAKGSHVSGSDGGGRGLLVKEGEQPPEAEKGKKMGSPLESPKGTPAC